MKRKLMIALALLLVALTAPAQQPAAWKDKKSVVWWRKTDLAEDEATGRTYNQWHAWYGALPKRARSFPGADKAYWRQWYLRGFNPDFAWKNTDPKQVHTFSRPLLKGEKPAD